MAEPAAAQSGSEFPRLRLAHRLDSGGGDGGGGEDGARYALFRIPIPRPVEGVTTDAVECGQCGEPVECTVYSAPSATRRRRRFLLLACALVACALVYCGFAGVYFSEPGDDPAKGWEVLVIPFLGILGLPALTIMALGLFTVYREDGGVRMKTSKGHSLREPDGREPQPR